MTTRAYGYCRVSTHEQANSGLGIAAQQAIIRAEARRRGWRLTLDVDKAVSGSSVRRPALTAILGRLRPGDVLVVSRLDRLSRSTLDFAELVERARRERWSIVALDIGVDMTTATGEMVAGTVACVAQYERRLIGDRTRAALAAKKARGESLGRPSQVPVHVRQRILHARRKGTSYRTIAEQLNRDGIPTVAGGKQWYASTVHAVERVTLRDEADPER